MRIARESGVAVGAIYNYFSSKTKLAFAVYQQLASQIIAAPVKDVDAYAEDPKTMTMAYIHDYIEIFWVDADRAVLFEYLTDVPVIQTPEIAEVFKPLRDYGHRVLTAAIAHH